MVAAEEPVPGRFLRVRHGHCELEIRLLAVGAILNHNLGTRTIKSPVPALLSHKLESLACSQILGDRVHEMPFIECWAAFSRLCPERLWPLAQYQSTRYACAC